MNFVPKISLPIAYEVDNFDFKEVFLADSKGNLDKASVDKFGDNRDAWERAAKQESMELFGKIEDPFSRTAKSFDVVDEIATTLVEKVSRTVDLYNPLKLMYDVKKGKLGTTLEAHEIQGGKVYNYAYGGFRNISRLEHQTYTVTTKPAAVHFSVPVEQMQAGRYTLPDLTFAASQAILAYKIRLGFDAWVSKYTTSSSYVTNANSARITATVLNSAIDTLADMDVNNINVIGRYSSLSNVSNFTGFSDKALEEIRMKGGLGKYRGANIVKIKYWVDQRYATVPWATSSVVLASDVKNFNRYCEIGGIKKSAWIDPAYGMFHIIFQFEDGCAIWKPQYGHRIYNVTTS